MTKQITILSGLFILFMGLTILHCHAGASDSPLEVLEGMVGPGGLSERQLVFEPGLMIGEETVSKTFQPSFVLTRTGRLLVFCQGRLQEGDDNGPKVILMNSSRDFGKTWEGVRVLSAPMNHFAISPYAATTAAGERISFLTCVGLKVTKNYYGNDYRLVREKTGIDLDQVGQDKAAVLCRYYSDDDGESWKLEVLTGEKSPLYKTYDGFTPVFLNTIGQVHKISEGPYKGRFILAAPIYAAADGEALTDNFRNFPCVGSGLLYSDDNGESWKMDSFIHDYLGNEASAVSVSRGEIILMIRRYMDPRQLDKNRPLAALKPGAGERIAHISRNGGTSWSEPFIVPVSSVRCHGTLAQSGKRIYFSIPNGIGNRPKKNWDDDRVNGAIFFSDDDSISWRYKIIEPGYFSYSTVGKLVDKYMITLYSRGGHGDKGIGYRIFKNEWLEKDARIPHPQKD